MSANLLIPTGLNFLSHKLLLCQFVFPCVNKQQQKPDRVLDPGVMDTVGAQKQVRRLFFPYVKIDNVPGNNEAVSGGNF
jgi:hypothetical protein